MLKRTHKTGSVLIALMVGGFASSLWLTSAAQAQLPIGNPSPTQKERKAPIGERRLQFESQCAQAADKKAFLLLHLDESDEVNLGFVARELGNYSGRDVVAALQNLTQYKQNPDTLIVLVAGEARKSLDRITATPDVSLLTNDLPLAKAFPIIQKYPSTLRATNSLRSNEYANAAIARYLQQKLEENPQDVVPLMVYRYASLLGTSIQNYPQEAKGAILANLRSPLSWVVSSTIRLVGTMKPSDVENFLPILVSMLYSDRQNSANVEVRSSVWELLSTQDDKVLPYLDTVLYSHNLQAQIQALSLLGQLQARGTNVLPMLLAFQKDYSEMLDMPRYETLNYSLNYELKRIQESNR